MKDRYLPARIAAGAAIIAAAVSISLTQIAIFICGLLAAAALVVGKSRKNSHEINFRSYYANLSGPVWIAGGLLFAWLAISFAVNTCRTGPGPAPGELFDVVHFGFGLLLFGLVRSAPPEDRILESCLAAFCWVLLLSGLVACFSEFRLARLATGHGFAASAINRPQHPLDLPFGIGLFRPVGFMNTRLTYAGLLVLILPLLWGRFRSTRSLPRATALALGLVLLVVNGTRSAWLGTILGGGFIFAYSIREYKLWASRPVRIGMITIGLLALPVGFLLLRGGLERQTDFQRSILWAGTGELIRANPIFGTGPGNFRARTLDWRTEFLEEQPQTLYWIHLTPAGHAHNDLMHLSAVGGLPAGLLFLALAAACMLVARRLYSVDVRASTRDPWGPVFSGLAGFFVAGLFQCYFQDDEVVVVFWILIASAGGFAGRDFRAAENARRNIAPGGPPVET